MSNNHSKYERAIVWDDWYMANVKCIVAKNIGNLSRLFLLMNLVPNKTFDVWFHDSNSYVLSFNPLSVPSIKINHFKDFIKQHHQHLSKLPVFSLSRY